MQYRWEQCGNSDARILHVNRRLFVFRDTIEDCEIPASLPDDQAELVRALRGVHGVRFASVGLYQISIIRAPLVPWETICPRVVAELAAWCGELGEPTNA